MILKFLLVELSYGAPFAVALLVAAGGLGRRKSKIWGSGRGEGGI